MRVGLIHTKVTLRATYLLECFGKGVRSCGDEVVWVDNPRDWQQQVRTLDAGVQVCFPNFSKASGEVGQFRVDVNDWFLTNNKRLVTIDTGFVRNQSDYELEQTRNKGKHDIVLFDIDNKATYERVLLDIYYEIGYDGIKRYADYGVGKITADTTDRWERLRTPLAPWRTTGDHILLVGQTVNGLSSQHINIYDWYAEIIERIRRFTDRPIVFRQHPRITKIRREGSRVEKDQANLYKTIGSVKNFRISEGWTMQDDLRNAWASVVFSSNAATQSVIAGVPCFAGHDSCMAWDVADHDVKHIEDPSLFDRQRWANQLAYSQWNCQEMIQGLPWRQLRPHARKPPRRTSVETYRQS